MIGVGVGVGFGGVGLSSAWLESQIRSIAGADLGGLWIGEDMVLSGANVTSWPGRVGGELAPVVASQYRTLSTIGGRKASVGSVIGHPRGLVLASDLVAKSFIVCTKVPPLPMPAAWSPLVANATASNLAITITASDDTLYTTSGWAHYVNGEAAETLEERAGEAIVIEGAKAGATETGIIVGSHAAGNVTWTYPSEIGCVVALTAVPSAGVRASITRLLQRYYRI